MYMNRNRRMHGCRHRFKRLIMSILVLSMLLTVTGSHADKGSDIKKPSSLLSSQGHAQLLSPLKCLTSVFGMGTGVSTSLSPPDL